MPICKFFTEGNCSKGDLCKYDHIYCAFFAQGKCKNGALCRFRHNQTVMSPKVPEPAEADILTDKEYEELCRSPRFYEFMRDSSVLKISSILKRNGLLLQHVKYDLRNIPKLIKDATDQNFDAYKYCKFETAEDR